MSVELKIHKGTGLLTGQSLCRSCVHSHIYTDARGEHIKCTASSSFSPVEPRGRVIECNEYRNQALTSLRDMYTIAWELKTDQKGQAGFRPPKKERE